MYIFIETKQQPKSYVKIQFDACPMLNDIGQNIFAFKLVNGDTIILNNNIWTTEQKMVPRLREYMCVHDPWVVLDEPPEWSIYCKHIDLTETQFYGVVTVLRPNETELLNFCSSLNNVKIERDTYYVMFGKRTLMRTCDYREVIQIINPQIHMDIHIICVRVHSII